MQDRSTCGGVGSIVLAGVHRWGESRFELLLPRPLLPVADSPLISYVLRWLRDSGIRQTTICANSESRLVRHCLGDGVRFGLDIRYYEDAVPRGPAGCVRDAILDSHARDFVVADGSLIPFVDLVGLIAAHRRSEAALTVVTQPSASSVESRNAMLRPTGVYVFSRRAIESIPEVGYQDIKEFVIPNLDRGGERIQTYEADSESLRVTSFDTYRLANARMIEELAGGSTMGQDYRRRGAALVHQDAKLADSVQLIGPVLIGPNTCIAPGATVVGPTWIGGACDVSERAVICRSVLWDDCSVGKNAIVDHCVIAGRAVVDDEAQLFNCLQAPADLGSAVHHSRRDVRADGEADSSSELRPSGLIHDHHGGMSGYDRPAAESHAGARVT